MKKLLFLLLLPSIAFADRLGSLRSSADVLLTTQAVAGSGAPAGSATELQARLNGTTFAAVVGSSSTATGPKISSGTVTILNTAWIQSTGTLRIGGSDANAWLVVNSPSATTIPSYLQGYPSIGVGDGSTDPKSNSQAVVFGTGNGGTVGCMGLRRGAGGLDHIGFCAPNDGLTGDIFWFLPSADATGYWHSNGTGTISVLPLSALDMAAILQTTNTWTAQQSWTSPKPSTFTYQVQVGSITGAGLSTCGDSTHALGYTSTTGLFSCQNVTGSGGSGGSSSLETMVNGVRVSTPTATLSALAGTNITLTSSLVNSVTAQITIAETAPLPPAINGFSYRRTLVVDHTKVSNSDQANFPVLVSTTAVQLSTITPIGHVANSSGFDIVFSTYPDCSFLLSWDTETYNATTGQYVAWVKMSSVSASVDVPFYMCYGKSSITSYQGGPSSNTWTNNYEGVYHMGDTGLLVESSSHTFTATNNGSTTQATGKIGTGGSLNGSTQYLTAGAASDYNLTSAGTVSGWFNMGSGASGPNSLFGKDNFSTDRNGYYFFANQSVSKLCYELADGAGFQQACENTGLATTQAWHYGVLTWDSSNVKMYIDGASDYSAAETKVPVSNVYVLSLGSRGDSVASTFNGQLDEMHLSRIARSADWVKTEYNNQNSPDTFYSMSPELNGLGQIAYTNIPQTWSAPQTFSSATIVTTTVTANQVLYTNASGQMVGSSSFTYMQHLGGVTDTEILKLEGVSPDIVFGSSNAIGMYFFDDYHAYQNSNLWGAIIEHPNAFPAVAQGLMNLYQRDGGGFFVDYTGQGKNTNGSFQIRYAAPAQEGTPRTVLETNSTGQVLIDNMYEDCSTGHVTDPVCAIDSSAAFMTSSTARGSLPYPQMSNTQRNAISSPKDGLGVWNNTNHTLDLFTNGSWASALTGNQSITFTGDSTGSGTTAVTLTAAANQPNIKTLSASSTTVTGNFLVSGFSQFNSTITVPTTQGFVQGSLGTTWDGGGSALTTGTTYWLQIPSSGTISGFTITANPSGSVSVNVSSSSAFGFANAGLICASACPNLSSATSQTDNTISGWTTSIAKDGYLYFVINTASTATQAVLSLRYSKS